MTVYYKLDHSEPGYLSQMLPRADGSWVKRADYEADLAAARTKIEQLEETVYRLKGGEMSDSFARDLVNQLREMGEVDPRDAEIERLTKARDNLSRLEQSHREQANEQFHRAEKAEAEIERLREVLKKIASTGHCDFAEVRSVLKKTHVEIERMKPMVIDWDGVRVIMDSNDVNWVHGDDYSSVVKERDEAQAQVAAAYEKAAKLVEEWTIYNWYQENITQEVSKDIRDLTLADTKAALEAYGREKVREAIQRVVDIVEDYCADDPMLAGHGYSASIRDAILADMEKLK